jgi:hypothetical protein
MIDAPPHWPLVQRRSSTCITVVEGKGAMDLGVAELLNALYAELAAEGMNSRDVVAIEFDPARNTVDVLTGTEPHLRSYPDLISIFRAVGQTCSQDRIDAKQLRRISFLEEEVKLELVSRSGDQRIIYAYPIDE